MKKLFTFLMVVVCLVLLAKTADAQTPVPMSSQGGLTYTENFNAISGWTNNFASGTGANRWGSVVINATGTIPDGKRTTVSSATFTTGTSGGVQKGTNNMVFLSTGGTDNTSSVADEIFLDFSTVNAGTISFDYAAVANSTGDRAASLRIYTSIDGTTYTELTGAAVLNLLNNSGTTGSITTVQLPANFNGSSTARIRFYNYNGTGGSSGSRAKISIDNLTITATAAGLTPPTLTAAPSATVDNAFDVTFSPDDATWRGAITVITINGNTLPGAAYDKTQSGKITFTPSASGFLQTSGANQPIIITATGYSSDNVSQTISPGAANKLGITTQPTAPLANGSNLQQQPVITIQDQYGNTTTSTATVVATVGSGSWTIGGTTSKAGVSGVATFTDLNATSAASVTGATIDFTSTGLTHIVSGTFNIPAPPSITTYVWNQTGTASFATGSNWTPTRSTPDAADILVVNNGATTTITNVPAQTIRNFKVSGNSTVSLTSTGTNALSMTDNDSALFIDAGSSVSLDGSNIITLTIPTGGAGFVKGNLTTTVASTTILVSDISGLVFRSGSIFTQNSTGSIFTTSGTANVIKFESGSKFTQLAGSNPFGLTQPNSKVVFDHGSLFSMQQNNSPGLSGRTYANLEINSAAFSQSPTGGNPLVVDSLIITQGVLNLNLTGGVTINGNIFVATGQTLAFTPASSNTYTLASTAGTITNLGTFTVSTNAIVSIDASANYTLSNNMTGMVGNITNNGVLNLGANSIAGTAGTFTMGATNSTLKIGHVQGLSSTASTGAIRVTGTRTYNFTGSGNVFEYNGTSGQNTGNQFPASIRNFTVSNNNASGVTLDANVTVSGTANVTGVLVLGTNTMTQTGGAATLQGTGTISLSSSLATQIGTYSSNTFQTNGRYIFNGTNMDIPSGTFNNFRVNGGGAQLTGNTTFSGVLEVNGALTVGAHTLTFSGSSPNRTGGGIDASDPSAVIEFTNGTTITLPSSLFSGNITNLSMHGSGLVNAVDNMTVTGTMDITGGFLNMAANTLSIGTSTSNTGDITRTGGGGVRGTIRRWFASGVSTNKIFPIDNGSGTYSAANISFTALTTGGTLTAFYTATGSGSLPDQGDGNYLPTGASMHFVNLINIAPQYWTITPGDGLAGPTYNLDITGDALPNVGNLNFIAIIKRANSGSPWAYDEGNHVTSTGSNTNPVLHVSGYTSFSDFGVGGNVQNPLPVELSSFVSSVSSNKVTLNWATTSELNNSGFDVERKSAASEWTKIGNVTGSGTSNEAHSYTLKDINLTSGKYNYRLKQIDYNGNFHYYPLSNEVIIGAPGKYNLAQNYPNPFNPATTISYELPETKFVSLKIYDMMGREVASLVNQNQEAGFYNVKFDASKLSSGMYFYKINAGDFVSTKKLMLLK